MRDIWDGNKWFNIIAVLPCLFWNYLFVIFLVFEIKFLTWKKCLQLLIMVVFSNLSLHTQRWRWWWWGWHWSIASRAWTNKEGKSRGKATQGLVSLLFLALFMWCHWSFLYGGSWTVLYTVYLSSIIVTSLCLKGGWVFSWIYMKKQLVVRPE